MTVERNPTKDEGHGRIVVGVDGSTESSGALRWATRQAQLTGTRLSVVMAWEYPTSFAWAPSYPLDFDPESDTHKMLDAMVEEVLGGNPPVEVETVVVEGRPAVALLEAARGAELLVVGCRGRGAFAGMLLGSVSQHCATHASCPVVVVHGPGGVAPAADRMPT